MLLCLLFFFLVNVRTLSYKGLRIVDCFMNWLEITIEIEGNLAVLLKYILFRKNGIKARLKVKDLSQFDPEWIDLGKG